MGKFTQRHEEALLWYYREAAGDLVDELGEVGLGLEDADLDRHTNKLVG